MTIRIVAKNNHAAAACVGPRDADLRHFTWSQNRRGHFVRRVKGRTVILHRVIAGRMGLSLWHYIDHRDRNPLNNRRCNLRAATNQQNQWNTSRQRNNSSPYKGVTWDRHNRRWLARIRYGSNQRRHLGSFLSARQAALAYNKAARQLHGRFAVLNQVR